MNKRVTALVGLLLLVCGSARASEQVGADHWSFQPVQRPPVPQARNDAWVRNPIDAFIAAKHEEHGLSPAPPAEKRVLIRRVYLDLIGLPPSPDEVRAFIEDESPDAYERVVDRLLDSPPYGERWGRHWMDVWRYSDWYGYRNELRNSQRHIWRWRDWIVRSLNEDKGYDRMIVEMLAGDELAGDDPDVLAATGFLARNWYKFNRNVWLDDTVEHTAKAFLGVTFNCARCHEHKYDPMAQEDYFRLRAFFEPHQVRTDRVPGEADVNKDGLPRVYDAEPDAKTYLFVRGNDKEPDKDNPLSPGLPDAFARAELPELRIETVSLPPAAYYPGIRNHVREETLASAKADLAKREADLKKAQETLAEARKRLDDWRAAHPTETNENESPAESEKAEAAESTKRGTEEKEQVEQRKPVPVFADDFSKPRPELWTIGDGEWEHKDGRLIQKATGAARRSLTSRAEHPPAFSVLLRFRITGGEQWKSVGVSFHQQSEGDLDTVYLSAHAGGPKVQVSHTRGGQTQYPEHGRKAHGVEVGRDHELRIDVRGRLVNVYADGELQLIYRLQEDRPAGRLSVWTFDASAEFDEVRLRPLAEGEHLVDEKPQVAAQNLTEGEALAAAAEAATLAVDAAEKQIAAARMNLGSIEARIAADDAKYADPPAADAESLARLASAATRQHAFAAAEAELAQARADVADAELKSSGDEKAKKALEEAKKRLDAATKKHESAQAEMNKPAGTDYDPLTTVYDNTSTGRRLALARWITDERNPLTARVAVNHIWMRHFGKPLVPTVFDFGGNGKPPTHPRLLDWLAVEIMTGGEADDRQPWSMKHLHRLIVTSNAYRMSSQGVGQGPRAEGQDDSNSRSPGGSQPLGPPPSALGPSDIDPDNIYLWRMNARRMEAEAVRDSVLHVAGRLDATMGGPELDEDKGQTTFRRSLYYRHAHEKYMTFLKLFDAASINECYRRDETVVPQQGLAMVNSPLVQDSSRVLGGKLSERVGADAERDGAFVDAAFHHVLGRSPRDDERAACIDYLNEQAAMLAEAGKLAAFDSGPDAAVKPSADPRQRAREGLMHVLFNHNEFLTIR